VSSDTVTADGFPNSSNNFANSLTISAPTATLSIASLRSLGPAQGQWYFPAPQKRGRRRFRAALPVSVGSSAAQ
jgi:hypothetical protein